MAVAQAQPSMHASLTEADAIDPRLERLADELSGAATPAGVAVRLWNGYEINIGGENPSCTLQINPPAGWRALLFRPDSLRLGEAYIHGDIDVVGNLRDVFPVADRIIGRKTSVADQLWVAWSLLRHSGRANHAAKLTGDRRSSSRTRKAISYHYDLPVEFWRLWLDSQLVYSCAYFEKADATIDEAQVASLDRYFDYAYRLLKPGGWFLNHGITTSPTNPLRKGDSFLDRYVFPDYHLASIGETTGAAEGAGFEVRDVENLREHYARTLELWHERLVQSRTEVEKVTDPVRYRIFDLYLAGSAYEFQVARLHLHQTLLLKPKAGDALAPQTRGDWYSH